MNGPSNGNGVLWSGSRAFRLNGSASSLVELTTIGTDTNPTVPLDVQFDNSTAGRVMVNVKRNAGDGGTSVVGSAYITVRGECQRLSVQ